MRSAILAVGAGLALCLTASVSAAEAATPEATEMPAAQEAPGQATLAGQALGEQVVGEEAFDAEAPTDAAFPGGETDAPTLSQPRSESQSGSESHSHSQSDSESDWELDAVSSEQAEPNPETISEANSKLGQLGYDEQGRPGRIHVVKPGDTLWDISDAYLGTPWVWPSVWTDNDDIENPHLILPGDRIWITPNEMRRVTQAEAERLLAGEPPAEVDDLPAAFDDGLEPPVEQAAPLRIYRYTEIQTTGFVTVDEYEGSATIVDSHEPRVWLTSQDSAIIGYGRGEVEAGDQFEVFRPGKRLIDHDTNRTIGYETIVLGWLEVTEVHDETASALIRLSRSEMRRGDHLLPRVPISPDIPIGSRPEIEGVVLHTPNRRAQMATSDVVYLNRGTDHGLAVGSPLEIYRGIGTAYDTLREDHLSLPDEIVAKLLVVSARPATAVALITHTRSEINVGDPFRGSNSID